MSADLAVLQKESEGAAFIGIARAVQISGLSKRTLLRWIKAGKFPRPVIAEGNCVRYDLAEVLAWRAEQFRKRAARELIENEQAAAEART